MDDKKLTFAQAMKKLEEINAWFQNEDIDLDKGLIKLQEGKDIIKYCREKLGKVENEFIKIKTEYEPAISDANVTFTSITETHEETVVSTTEEIPF